MPSGVPQKWPTDKEVLAAAEVLPSVSALARHFGKKHPSFESFLKRNPELHANVRAKLAGARTDRVVADVPDPDGDESVSAFTEDVRKAISGKKPKTVEGLADGLDVSPRRVRAALDALREQGFRVPEEGEGEADGIVLQKVAPERVNLHRSLLEGRELTVGLVSDTHLSSNEEALPELELAYDMFAERGITEVLHAGDWTCGLGIFRTQAAEIKAHTFEAQVERLVEIYPRRDGIRTRGISGNHDIEGDLGRMGANPVVAFANQRDDIDFLGDYSAWVNYGTDKAPCWLHLLHGSGGMSYAYSYKAQKLVDGYSGGRKPAILAVGHWHVAGWINQRSVNVIWPACFEWQSHFLKRKGLSPAVGFHILNLTVAADGSLVGFRPEWFQFFEGRAVESADAVSAAA